MNAETEQARVPYLGVRLYLLCGSGHSTLPTEFQRLYTPTAFREERAVWRSVIQLNLVRSVRTILDAVASALHKHDVGDDSGSEEEAMGPLDGVRALAARLESVRAVESALIARLVPRDEEEPTRLRAEEVFVRTGSAWKGHSGAPDLSDDDVSARIHAARLDMLALWNHSSTREILRRRKIRLEESPGLCVLISVDPTTAHALSRTAFWTTLSE
jgi:hypothetical protein